MYQAGDTDDMNVAERSSASSSRVGRTRVGETDKTDEEIFDFICRWNSDGGGSRNYNLLTNSCQTFAVHLGRFLCDGGGRFPNAGGVQCATGRDHFIASVGGGEVACASYGGAKLALSAPMLGVQGINGKSALGAFVQAEVAKAEVGADTSMGRVGVTWGLNANTGAGVC